MQNIPSFSDIQNAHMRITGKIKHTPVFSSASINEITGTNVFFKCENFQKTGAFKFRGATNAVLTLPENDLLKGVATHSSGNHGAALAHAAALNNIRCYVVMPHTAPKIKIEAVRHYGAEITFCEPVLQDREATLNKVIGRTGAVMIHPYNNFHVVCGQGTAAKELLEEIPSLEVLFAPVGGGGLLAGTSLAAKSIFPEIQVYGCEPANADDAQRSFKTGMIQPPLPPATIADGLLTSLCELTFNIIRKNVDDIFTVSEDAIIHAMKIIWQRMKIIVEPSSAVPLAVLIENRSLFKGRQAGIILSGGNVDIERLPF